MQEPMTAPDGVPCLRETLRQCNRRISGMLDRLEDLASEFVAEPVAPPADLPARARACIAEIDEALNLHLDDEERDVFPELLASAESPARRAQAFELVSLLLVEHRELAELWHALRIALLAMGSGVTVALPGGTAAEFLVRARLHLAREDVELADLMGTMKSARAREIAISIAKRHGESNPCTGA